MAKETVLKLSDAHNIPLSGGKASSLAKLVQAGFSVPNGFVITTKVENINTSVKNEILKEFDRLDSKYVAVRSSAVSEDGSRDAWAGQLDTFLNIDRNNLIEKIKLCQQSSKSERALSYAEQKGLKTSGVAVIVQAMIQSEVSGIAFSANPITRNDDEMIIEAGFGLNEPIVSGEITPDTYILAKPSLKIQQKHISTQTKQLSQAKDGINEWLDVSDPNSQKLSYKQVHEVAKTILKLEKFFEFPVDVEWTLANDELFILQSRPITTLG